MNEFRDAIVKIRTIQVDVAYMDALNGTEVVVDGSLPFQAMNEVDRGRFGGYGVSVRSRPNSE